MLLMSGVFASFHLLQDSINGGFLEGLIPIDTVHNFFYFFEIFPRLGKVCNKGANLRLAL